MTTDLNFTLGGGGGEGGGGMRMMVYTEWWLTMWNFYIYHPSNITTFLVGQD